MAGISTWYPPARRSWYGGASSRRHTARMIIFSRCWVATFKTSGRRSPRCYLNVSVGRGGNFAHHKTPAKFEAEGETDPKFPNLLHWRRRQAPDLSREFGGEPEGRGPARLATTYAPPKAEWRRLGQRALFADHVRTRRKETYERCYHRGYVGETVTQSPRWR